MSYYLLKTREMADELKISTQTLRHYIKSYDGFPFIKIGDRTYRFRKNDVFNFIANYVNKNDRRKYNPGIKKKSGIKKEVELIKPKYLYR